MRNKKLIVTVRDENSARLWSYTPFPKRPRFSYPRRDIHARDSIIIINIRVSAILLSHYPVSNSQLDDEQ